MTAEVQKRLAEIAKEYPIGSFHQSGRAECVVSVVELEDNARGGLRVGVYVMGTAALNDGPLRQKVYEEDLPVCFLDTKVALPDNYVSCVLEKIDGKYVEPVGTELGLRGREYKVTIKK